MTNARSAHLSSVRRLVVKVGSQVLSRSGTLALDVFDALCAELAALLDRGLQVALVTSGAVAAGRFLLGLKDRPRTIPLKQASAAAGQALLMQQYAQRLNPRGYQIAQILLTSDDLRNRRRFLNARNTLRTLFDLKVLPVINENDTVVVEEIQFGDNDRLSAQVTNLIEAQLLVILTDIDGFYDADPRSVPTARRYSTITELTKQHLGQASATRSDLGLGGMVTKLEAARQAALSGAATVVALGTAPGVLGRILDGEDVGTFIAARPGIGTRKHWIAFANEPVGDLLVDDGAAKALLEWKRSLLPSGLIGVRGDFDAGAAVRVLSPDGREVGRGLVRYSASELCRIAGRQTSELAAVLGYHSYNEVIHRDDLVVTRHHQPGSPT